jgi:hypothetical protein
MIMLLLSILLPCLTTQEFVQAVWYEPNGVTIISADRVEVFETWPVRAQGLVQDWLSDGQYDLDKDGIVNLKDFNVIAQNYYLSKHGTYTYTVTVKE